MDEWLEVTLDGQRFDPRRRSNNGNQTVKEAWPNGSGKRLFSRSWVHVPLSYARCENMFVGRLKDVHDTSTVW